MARPAGPGATTLSEALLSMKSDSLGAMVRQLPIPKPRPTRKADMAAAVERRPAVPAKSEDAFRKAVRKPGYGLPKARPPARRA